MAIDRLYLVAPQLHNQRVELKSSKREQMEKARTQGKGKQKENDVGELENIIKLINKASERSLTDQSVILDGGMKARLEKLRQRDDAKVALLIYSITCASCPHHRKLLLSNIWLSTPTLDAFTVRTPS